MSTVAHSQPATAQARLNWRRIVLIVLTIVGIADAGYLTYEKFSGGHIQCFGGEVFNKCNEVSNSPWGEWVFPNGTSAGLHVPTATMGLLMYVTLFALLIIPLGRWRQFADLAVFGIAFAGVLYSAYLTYIEAFVLRAWCPYCVISATTVTLIWLFAWPRPAPDEAEDEEEEEEAAQA